MPHKIETGYRPEFPDPIGEAILAKIRLDLNIPATSARVLDVYTIDAELSQTELNDIGAKLLSDPVNQQFSIDSPLFKPPFFSVAVAVYLRPAVKDSVGSTAKEAIEELLQRRLKGEVYFGKHYLFSGNISEEDGKRIGKELSNELIQCFEVKTAKSFGEAGFGFYIPKAGEVGGGKVSYINIGVSSEQLVQISKSRLLSLSLEEMLCIKRHYENPKTKETRRRHGLEGMPTDVELEAIAQTWSEHCKHKIFNAKISLIEGKKRKVIDSLFRTYIRGATERLMKEKKWLLSVFSDNAGIIEFVPGWNVAMKVETHNSPSALDPYGGALTGILGVNRDILGCGIGAKPIFNTDVFCFADPKYDGQIPPRLFHPKRVLEGVRAGVAAGGNASGIPTINGSLYFDDRYLGKPLVYCGTCGIMPSHVAGKKTHEKAVCPGDRIFMVGGRIGKDGIHGATFSSQKLDETSPVSAVQLGDPYTQKKMVDFLIEARDLGLYNAITDNGAGGLSSSVGEMARLSGGCTINLDRAPLKYSGLDPWEIFVSESQERMTVAVPPSKAERFASLASKHGVEVSDIGEFDSSGFLKILYGAKVVALLSMDFLHNGVPQLKLEAKLWKGRAKRKERQEWKEEDLGAALLCLLERPNICSKEYIIRQYDHEVQGGSAIKPLCGVFSDGPSDAGVVAPLLGRREGIVVSNGLCPRYSDFDAYQMAANAVDEAVRNYVSAGGSLERLALLDNFCWSDPVYSRENPEGKHKLAQLVYSCQGLYRACLAYKAPLISGKDSMKNDYKHGKWKISVPPTLLITAIGVAKDVEKCQTTDFKSQNDSIYALGRTYCELGGSEYSAMRSIPGGCVPKVNFKANYALYKKLEAAISRGLVASCHDCSEGGLAVAIAECCIGGRIGAKISLADRRLSEAQLLFSESAGRFVVSVKKEKEKAFAKAMRGTAFRKIGEVGGDSLKISVNGKESLCVEVKRLVSSWKRTMGW